MNRKILVVDDEKAIVDVLQKFFVSAGCEVDTAGGVPEALRKIGATVYPVVITDLCFPGKESGSSILKAAKQRSPETQVIMITGYGSIKSAVDMMREGANDYVTKPFDLNELKQKVWRLFDLKQAEETLSDSHESIVAIESAAGDAITHLELKVAQLQGNMTKISGFAQELIKKLPKNSPSLPLARKIRNAARIKD